MRFGVRRLFAFLALVASAGLSTQAHAEGSACVTAAEDGQRWQKAGHLTAAAKYFGTCSDAICPAAVRDDCRKWADELQAQLSSIVVDARDASDRVVSDTVVMVDDVVVPRSIDQSILVDSGAHRFVFRREGSYSVYQEAVIQPGIKNRVFKVRFSAEVPAAERPARRNVGPFVVGGLGVAAIATGAIFLLAAPKEPSNCEGASTCHYPVGSDVTYDIAADASKADAHHTFTVAGAITLGVGTAALAAGVLWWLVAGEEPKTGLRLTPLGLDGTF